MLLVCFILYAATSIRWWFLRAHVSTWLFFFCCFRPVYSVSMQFPLACESHVWLVWGFLCVSGGILQLGSDKSLLHSKRDTCRRSEVVFHLLTLVLSISSAPLVRDECSCTWDGHDACGMSRVLLYEVRWVNVDVLREIRTCRRWWLLLLLTPLHCYSISLTAAGLWFYTQGRVWMWMKWCTSRVEWENCHVESGDRIQLGGGIILVGTSVHSALDMEWMNQRVPLLLSVNVTPLGCTLWCTVASRHDNHSLGDVDSQFAFRGFDEKGYILT
jgi:hypothetical protein